MKIWHSMLRPWLASSESELPQCSLRLFPCLLTPSLLICKSMRLITWLTVTYNLLIPSVYILHTSPRCLTGQCLLPSIRKAGGMERPYLRKLGSGPSFEWKAIFRLFLNPLPYTTHKPSPTHRLHTVDSHAQNVLDFAFPLTWASFGHPYSKYSTRTPRDVQRRVVNLRQRWTLLRDFFDAET